MGGDARRSSQMAQEDAEPSIPYSRIPGLPSRYATALRSMDLDGNGSISVSELLSLHHRNRRLAAGAFVLVVGILLLIASLFGVNWASLILARQTDTNNGQHAMTAKGSADIVATAT